MPHWPDRRLLELLQLESPIIQAPMAGSDSLALATAVASTGALGSLACALLSPDAIREAVAKFRASSAGRINLNFFCHTMTAPDPSAMDRWKMLLQPHFDRWSLDIEAVPQARLRLPFDADACAALEESVPDVVSFHFGMPEAGLVDRLKRRGIKVLSSATSVAEARWLEARGCDAMIAQGSEAGGHRAMFLETTIATQIGLFALLPQVADAVSVPVIAAGGIADARGVAAAFALGASGVQIGTAYLKCPEANVSPLYRQALDQPHNTALTNLFSGRPARGIVNRYIEEAGPMNDAAPPFPHAATLVGPLRAASESVGSTDYMQMWAGQAALLAPSMPAAEYTRKLVDDTLRLLR